MRAARLALGAALALGGAGPTAGLAAGSRLAVRVALPGPGPTPLRQVPAPVLRQTSIAPAVAGPAVAAAMIPSQAPAAAPALSLLQDFQQGLLAAEDSGGAQAAADRLAGSFDGSAARRAGGILMHVTSLPSPRGIGDLGPEACRFVDFLARAGQRYWQVLPLTPTEAGAGNSPYSSFSAFARNTLLISPERLVADGWLAPEDIGPARDTPGDIDYAAVSADQARILAKVWERYRARPRLQEEFQGFKDENSYWLEDYALFVALRESFPGGTWNDWPAGYRRRDPQALAEFAREHAERVEALKLEQFIFVRQWEALKSYAAERGVRFIGDVPIYIGYDSADAWAHPGFFQLDEKLAMKFVSGIPPDRFSADGQRWGTPVYDWTALGADGYRWWLERLRGTLRLVDRVRIDHFRGLVQYWRVPAGAKTARPEEGAAWADGPGDAFFAALAAAFPDRLIAEDLGVITPDVVAVMERYGLPGMKVLHYAFGGEDIVKNPYLPENHVPRSVAYTGTHDNNTTVGWLAEDLSPLEKKNLQAYLRGRGIEPPRDLRELAWVVVGLAVQSVADTAILPMQDVLGLGSEARMNFPGKPTGYWRWRMKLGALREDIVRRLRVLSERAGR
ncbi:MAG: 4-alpha-glucanotransferase [Elusimicrobia bacterium]|nr:4-alpha-glucanotransferase [Elusimicrobiota bacterium]